jgi:peptidoglycan/xylan/chitin deacetylase (PgdA/CDA1 family)
VRRLLPWLLGAAIVAAGLSLTARDLAAAARFDPLRSVSTTRREVALTFEVSRAQTAVGAILKTLGAVRATFFVTGAWARGHADVIRSVLAAGDEVESLGNRPVALSRYPPAVVREELAAGVAALKADGITPRFLRPVAGQYDAELLQLADAAGLRLCLWDIDGLDWTQPGPDAVAQRVLAAVHPGAIIRLQADDAVPDTVPALAAILRGLASDGLRPVTLAQMASA